MIVAAVAVLASCAHRDGLRGWDPVAAARDSHALVIVGTFSSLRVTADGVFGAEVRIAVTDEPHYQAVVQFGAGQVCGPTEHRKQACFGLSNLHVVEARFDWDRPATGRMAFVSFHIPGPGPYSGRFEGMITDEALTGTFTPTNGKPWPLVMRRGLPFHERQAKPPEAGR